MNEFETWIYRAIIGAALLIIFFVIKSYVNAINERFEKTSDEIDKLVSKIDELISSINLLKISNGAYDERFSGLNNRLLDMSKDIGSLQGEVKTLTHKQDKCQYCNEK